jgi:RimJ/RimL family protein N-acetyltransferase
VSHPLLPVPLPDPPLTDGRVQLRPWAPADTDALVAAWHDPDIARWTGVPPRTDEASARRWIEGDAHRRARGLALDLVIELADEVVGEVGLADIDPAGRSAEVGWWVAPAHRRQGIATAAARLVSVWAVTELCVDSVVAVCHLGNPASAAVARGAGFVLDGTVDGVERWRCRP